MQDNTVQIDCSRTGNQVRRNEFLQLDITVPSAVSQPIRAVKDSSLLKLD